MIADAPPTPLVVDNGPGEVGLIKAAIHKAKGTPIAISQSGQRADFGTLVHSINDFWIMNVQLPRRSEDE